MSMAKRINNFKYEILKGNHKISRFLNNDFINYLIPNIDYNLSLIHIYNIFIALKDHYDKLVEEADQNFVASSCLLYTSRCV